MEKKDFLEILKFWKEEKLKEVKPLLERTENCLYFAEVEKYVKKGKSALSLNQLQHIDSCQYCQKLIEGFQKELTPRFSLKEALKKAFASINEATNNLFAKLSLAFSPKFAPVLVPVLAVVLIFFVTAPLLTPSMQLKNLELVPYATTLKTRGLIRGQENLYKIKFKPLYNGYAYLFEIKKDIVGLLIQQKITKNTEAILPQDENIGIEKEGQLVILLSQKPIKDISLAKEIILKNAAKNEPDLLKTLKKGLKRKDLDVRYF